MLSVIDTLHALRWACTLLGYGHELHVREFFEMLILRARQRPQQLDNFRAYYEAAAIRLCRKMRAGKTADAVVPGDHEQQTDEDDKQQNDKGAGKAKRQQQWGKWQSWQHREVGATEMMVSRSVPHLLIHPIQVSHRPMFRTLGSPCPGGGGTSRPDRRRGIHRTHLSFAWHSRPGEARDGRSSRQASSQSAPSSNMQVIRGHGHCICGTAQAVSYCAGRPGVGATSSRQLDLTPG